jgi:chaperonin GroES
MQIQPMQDRILLKPVAKETVTKSGIVLPESKERPQVYEVVAVGPGKENKDGKFVTINVKPGDKVISGQYSGDDVKLDGVEHKIVGFDYILAKVA